MFISLNFSLTLNCCTVVFLWSSLDESLSIAIELFVELLVWLEQGESLELDSEIDYIVWVISVSKN